LTGGGFAKKVAPMAAELSPELQTFREAIQNIVDTHKLRLAAVGGNLLIRIFDVCEWTIVTSGPRLGIYDEATDDNVDFVLACDEDILHDLLDGEDIDLEALIEQGYLIMEGDFKIYERFMGMASNKSALDIRSGR
jgi:ubiquinone biosynthesis protein UbiJ